MTSSERGVYRDLIDLAYMSDNRIAYSVEMLARYTNSDADTIQRILQLKGKKKGDFWTIPSCEKRIELMQVNRQNGSKGGRPKKGTKTQTKTHSETETEPITKDNGNPNDNRNESQTQRQREREREREREKEIEEEREKGNIPPSPAAAAIPVFKQVFKTMDDVMKSIIEDENSLNDIGAVAKIPKPEDVPKMIEEFCSYQKAIEKFHTDRSEFKKHFFSWYARKYPNNAPEKIKNDGPPQRQGIFDGELVGKWIWRFNGWRDTTTFTDDQKRRNGLK